MDVVLDIETDSLDATLVYCIVAKDRETGKHYVWKGDQCINTFPMFAKRVNKFIMHNGISFDAPTLNRLLGTQIKLSQVEDTLILSQLTNPVRENGHSLEAWGEKLQFNKIDFKDFSHLSEEMVTYCKRDVDITERVWINLQPDMQKIDRRAIDLEYKIRALVSQQERNGFTLDLQKATSLTARLQDKSFELEREVQTRFVPIPVAVKEVTPRYKKDGSLSSVGLRHIQDTTTVAGPHTSIDYQTFNLASRQQIVSRLTKCGWQPKKFTEKGHAIVDESVLRGVDIPEAQMIAEYLTLKKRIAQVQSWIDAVHEDGKVHGQVLTLRAISGRMAHHSPNMAQVPASYSPYGKECRECWTVGDAANVLVGCDASSLELRALAHYLNDPSFTKEVVEGDIHTANQKAAGLDTRDQAKTFIYAFIYGAGAAKIGQVVGGTSQDGQRLIDTFLGNVPALAVLRERVDKASQRGYLKGLDGRWLKVRNQHAAVNLLIQGAGAVICKQWLIEINSLVRQHQVKAKLVASIHDEYQHEVYRPQANRFGELTKLAMKNTERSLKIKCPLDSEYKIGQNWSETH